MIFLLRKSIANIGNGCLSLWEDWLKLARQAWSYLRARYRRFRTPKELRDADFYLWIENLNKCRVCPFLDPNNGRPTCDICGCNVEIKARWMSERCDIGEWDNTIHLRDRIQTLAGADQPTTTPVNRETHLTIHNPNHHSTHQTEPTP